MLNGIYKFRADQLNNFSYWFFEKPKLGGIFEH